MESVGSPWPAYQVGWARGGWYWHIWAFQAPRWQGLREGRYSGVGQSRRGGSRGAPMGTQGPKKPNWWVLGAFGGGGEALSWGKKAKLHSVQLKRLSCTQCNSRYNRTSPQPPVLFCFGLFWSTRRTNAFCSALPPGYTEVVQESRGDGGAAAGQGSGGRLGPAPHRPGLAGRRRPVGGGQAKIRGLSDKICSAGGRSLAICAPSAQSARRRH